MIIIRVCVCVCVQGGWQRVLCWPSVQKIPLWKMGAFSIIVWDALLTLLLLLLLPCGDLSFSCSVLTSGVLLHFAPGVIRSEKWNRVGG